MGYSTRVSVPDALTNPGAIDDEGRLRYAAMGMPLGHKPTGMTASIVLHARQDAASRVERIRRELLAEEAGDVALEASDASRAPSTAGPAFSSSMTPRKVRS